MLKGTIFITKDPQVIINRPLDNSMVIINMDEDHKLSETIPNAIEGITLLPPVEAKIAEVDGDEVRYNSLYLTHLYNQQDFMSAIIAFLYKGGNMIIYLPDEYNYTRQKLCELIFHIYGIHIGDLEDPNNNQCFYNLKCIPFWLNILFKRDLISWMDWVKMMPIDAYDMNGVLGGDPYLFNKAVLCMNPYAESISEKVDEFKNFHKMIHQNPMLKPAIRGI